MSIWRWADLFPADRAVPTPATPGPSYAPPPERFRVTLGEGDTPLLRSRRIGPAAGLDNLGFKLETVSPTGSYKDRFAAAAVADMLAAGKTRCVATSSGNTGSALAAYCAAADMACEIAVVESAPAGKLRQMMAYGAEVYRIKGFGLDADATRCAFDYVQKQGARPGASIQVSAFAISPVGMAGVQTLAYELAEQWPKVEHVFVPAGGGGLALAVARGFAGLVRLGKIAASPKVHCVQPEGNDTIAGPLRRGDERARPVACTTQISGLQVPTVLDGHDVIRACRASGGAGHLVTDQSVWDAQARLAREEGIFCEPAGAAALAAALQAAGRGELRRDAQVVCLVTGSGFKDPPSLERMLAGCDCPTRELSDLH